METHYTSWQRTNQLLEMIDNGQLDKNQVIMACVKYMSEDDVADMMLCLEMMPDDEESENEEEE